MRRIISIWRLVRYNTGVDPYVDVVIAQTTLLNNQETLNALRGRRDDLSG